MVSVFSVFSEAGEFEIDEHTLFLCHYNKSLDADYAKGDPSHHGVAFLTEQGRYGKALDASSEGGYQGLSYQTEGNINPDEGTLEMWVKMKFTVKEAVLETPLTFLPPSKREKVKPKLKYGRCYFFSCRNNPENQFFLYLGETMHLFFYEVKNGGGTWSSRTVGTDLSRDWRKDEWHHIAVTWSKSAGKKCLFIDGKLVNEGKTTGLCTPFTEMAVGSFMGRWKAEAVIDEVRISDIVRYTKDFVLDN